MPLVKCPENECGERISDTAKSCPYCGCDIYETLQRQHFPYFLLIFSGSILAGLWIFTQKNTYGLVGLGVAGVGVALKFWAKLKRYL